MGILESIDQLVGAFVPPLQNMGGLLSQIVVLNVNGTNQAMPISTAALTAFVSPWVDNLGAICNALASFMAAL